MARSLRASAAAAAKKILAQAADDGGAVDVDIARTTKPATATRRAAGQKRTRQESPEYEAEDGDDDDHEDPEDEDEDEDEDDTGSGSARRRPKKEPRLDPEETQRRLDRLLSSASKREDATSPATTGTKIKKRKKSAAPRENALATRLFAASSSSPPPPACCPPERRHSVDYHRPLLLHGADGAAARRALLAWYDRVSATRGMPWRRAQWLDPRTAARPELARRAYEVWISEIMAQQTRIAVVIGYWTRWMARWPTVADLAVAEPHEVMHEWSGLGYYSRAARLHEAARVVVADPVLQGLLPADVATLEDRVPGVGRYTAGAISAIVFGRAAAMVDGNVIRVLSRQLGLFADSKADKQRVDLLWAAAEALVQAVARDGGGDVDDNDDNDDKKDPIISDRPGRWGQALMELGSTVCAPKPDCAACPITSTCRAYAEGLRLYDHVRGRPASVIKVDKDDGKACDLCEQFPELDDEEAAAKAGKKSGKSPFFDAADIEDAAAGLALRDDALATVVNHARAFPLRRPKKPVREVDTLVCAIRTKGGGGGGSDGRQPVYLLHQRPDKGLLASLWQLPSYDVPLAGAAGGLTKAARRKEAEAFVGRWLSGSSSSSSSSSTTKKACPAKVRVQTSQTKDLGSVPWLFSHLRQTMHVYLFEVEADASVAGVAELPAPAACCWSSVDEAEDRYSMGTGMRKCWDLVKEA